MKHNDDQGMYQYKDDAWKEIGKGIFIGYLIIGSLAGILCAIHRWVI